MFTLKQTSKNNSGRLGLLHTDHGDIETPFFMPIATKGVIKSVDIERFASLNSNILLSNTYHLYLKPGLDILQKAGGLHSFMRWTGPILTDSGGFQAFSLGRRQQIGDEQAESLSKIKKPRLTADGVEFQSVYDGSAHKFTPEKVVDIQRVIGSDIMMVLDECVENPASYEIAQSAVDRTTQWAERSYAHYKNTNKLYKHDQKLFAIVQGSIYEDLRARSAKELTAIDFDGFAIGGLAVGETHEEMYEMLDVVCPLLPKNKPRYLMGVGKPENIVEAVRRGVDMFDCVIPSREARHARLYSFVEAVDSFLSRDFYIEETITNEKFSQDFSPISKTSNVNLLKKYSKAYLHHLFKIGDPLALTLATLNNIEFYLKLMEQIRNGIKSGIL